MPTLSIPAINAPLTKRAERPLAEAHCQRERLWAHLLRKLHAGAYGSGHSTYSKAASEVLRAFLPDCWGRRDVPNGMVYEIHTGLDLLANSIGEARFWGGVHWRKDQEFGHAATGVVSPAGTTLDRQVACDATSALDQVLLVISSSAAPIAVAELLKWIEPSTPKYFLRMLRLLHKKRLIELSNGDTMVQILPPGTAAVDQLIAKRTR